MLTSVLCHPTVFLMPEYLLTSIPLFSCERFWNGKKRDSISKSCYVSSNVCIPSVTRLIVIKWVYLGKSQISVSALLGWG